MKSRIARTQRIFEYEQQVYRRLRLEAASLLEKIRNCNEAIEQIRRQNRIALEDFAAIDSITSRLNISSLTERLSIAISSKMKEIECLEKELESVHQKLTANKINSEAIEKLLTKQKRQYKDEWSQRQNHELLDIATQRFLESER